MKFDVCIIGGGPGGIYSAILCSNFNLSCCIIEQNNFIGGQPILHYPEKMIYDFPGYKQIKSKTLIQNLISQLCSLEFNKPNVLFNEDLLSIDNKKDNFIINTKTTNIESKAIIFATGVGKYSPNKLIIDNNEQNSENIHYFYKNDELYKNKKIIILGGGDSAIDWVNHLYENKITNDIILIHRRNEFRAREEKINRLKKNNIQCYTNYSIINNKENKLTIQNNENNEQKIIKYDYLIVQFGISFQKNDIQNLIPKIELNELKNKINVDINNQSSIKNIYAIGNCCYYQNNPNMIITACSDGARAVCNIKKTLFKDRENNIKW